MPIPTKVLQGLPVAGYRPQTTTAVDMVNRMKVREEELLRELDAMAGDMNIDPRWLQIGRTGIQQAFMAINRSVFQPGRITLPGDEA
jgi:hypothetical protein